MCKKLSTLNYGFFIKDHDQWKWDLCDHCELPPKKISDQVVSNTAPQHWVTSVICERIWPLAGPKSCSHSRATNWIWITTMELPKPLGEFFPRQKEKGLDRHGDFRSHLVHTFQFRDLTWLSTQKKNSRGLQMVTNVTKKSGRCWWLCSLIDWLLNSLLSMGDLENVSAILVISVGVVPLFVMSSIALFVSLWHIWKNPLLF